MTKADILARVKRGEMSEEQGVEMLEKLERILLAHRPQTPTAPTPERFPPRFKVAEKSGWCSVYFDGLWRPCTLPSSLWLELLAPQNIARFKEFLEANKNRFRNKVSDADS